MNTWKHSDLDALEFRTIATRTVEIAQTLKSLSSNRQWILKNSLFLHTSAGRYCSLIKTHSNLFYSLFRLTSNALHGFGALSVQDKKPFEGATHPRFQDEGFPDQDGGALPWCILLRIIKNRRSSSIMEFHGFEPMLPLTAISHVSIAIDRKTMCLRNEREFATMSSSFYL
jgi:hypothetical protein